MKLRWAYKWLICALFLIFPSAVFAGNVTNPAFSPPLKRKVFSLEITGSSDAVKPESRDSTIITEIDMTQIYVKGSYSFFKGSEVSLKLGAADAKAIHAFGTGGDMKDSFKFSAGASGKQSFEIRPNLRVGAVVNYTYFGDYKESKDFVSSGLPVSEVVRINNPWEITAALAVSHIEQEFTPFGGIMVSWRRFEAKDEKTTGGVTSATIARLKEDGLVGLLAGVEFFGDRIKGTVEIQVSKKSSAGFSLLYIF